MHELNRSIFFLKKTSYIIDQGSPDDPTELSFDKGESLEILDKRGNWWHARKQDGTTGIVPSNYVSFKLISLFIFLIKSL